MIVGDTGGDPNGWGIQWESGVQYTSMGLPDQWVTLARNAGISPEPRGEYVFNLRDGVDWSRALQVVAPCVSIDAC